MLSPTPGTLWALSREHFLLPMLLTGELNRTVGMAPPTHTCLCYSFSMIFHCPQLYMSSSSMHHNCTPSPHILPCSKPVLLILALPPYTSLAPSQLKPGIAFTPPNSTRPGQVNCRRREQTDWGNLKCHFLFKSFSKVTRRWESSQGLESNTQQPFVRIS